MVFVYFVIVRNFEFREGSFPVSSSNKQYKHGNIFSLALIVQTARRCAPASWRSTRIMKW